MRTSLLLCASFTAILATADTYYVSLDGTHVHPFDSWADAATNIQSAVDAAGDDDTVLVSNGLYRVGATPASGHSTSNRVMIPAAITVRSLSGPGHTAIVGQGPSGSEAVRCAYLVDGARLFGFILSNGFVNPVGSSAADCRGGGVLLDQGGVVSNCCIMFNTATDGGGAYCNAGGLIHSCLMISNHAFMYGGGAAADYGGVVSNCAIIANWSSKSSGGVYCNFTGTVHSCTIQGNMASLDGGGAYLDHASTMRDCVVNSNCALGSGGGILSYMSSVSHTIIDSNIASNGMGGGVHCDHSTSRNCLIIRNAASLYSGYGGGMYCGSQNTIESCTISGNTAYNGGGIWLGSQNWAVNSIVYGNLPGGNYYSSSPDNTFNYTCTAPLIPGEGNIDDNPEFVDYLNVDYRLQPISPCIDNGFDFAWMTTGVDLDGNERIFNLIVDMGAYEWIPEPGFVIGHWLLVIGYWSLRKRKSS